jgi:hypothetical protein
LKLGGHVGVDREQDWVVRWRADECEVLDFKEWKLELMVSTIQVPQTNLWPVLV